MSFIPDKKSNIVYSKEDNSLDDRMDDIGKRLQEKQNLDMKTKEMTTVEANGKKYIKITYYEPMTENKPTVRDLRKELGLDK